MNAEQQLLLRTFWISACCLTPAALLLLWLFIVQLFSWLHSRWKQKHIQTD